ncbi:MAG: hypothetical protein VX899_02210 [Myxococcota bacterium]|nr:hypothetical protein [Myxococcota bacterium]
MVTLLLLACAQEAPCPTWYADVDADGYGDSADGVQSCEPLPGRIDNRDDCDDRDADTHPGAVDLHGDGKDQDCNTQQDCDGLPEISAVELQDCSQRVNIAGSLSETPPGDCICRIDGDLTISERLDLSQLASLQQVQGYVRIGGGREEDINLPQLRSVGRSLTGEPAAPLRLSLPQLRQAGEILLSGVGELDLSRLEHLGDLRLSNHQSTHLALPALQSIDSLDLRHSSVLERLSLPAGTHIGALTILEMPSLSSTVSPSPFTVEEVRWTQSGGEGLLVLPKSLHTLETYGPDATLTVLGASEVTLLQHNAGTLTAPDLGRADSLVSYGALSTPALTELGSATVSTGDSWSAPLLEALEAADLWATDLDLPALRSVDTGFLGGAELPALERVGDVKAYGTYPALREVAFGLSGSPIAPALTHLGAPASLDAPTGSLPALRTVSAPLTLSGHAELPALQSAQAPITLDGVAEFYTPALTDMAYVELVGETAPLLPDPFPGGLLPTNYQPRTELRIHTLQGGLRLWDEKHRDAPWISVDTVQGNLSLRADWDSLDALRVGRVEGDLSYCLRSVPTTELDTWLASIELVGTTEDTCP